MTQHQLSSSAQRGRQLVLGDLYESSDLLRKTVESLIERRTQHPASPRELLGPELAQERIGVRQQRAEGVLGGCHHREPLLENSLCGSSPAACQLTVQIGETE